MLVGIPFCKLYVLLSLSERPQSGFRITRNKKVLLKYQNASDVFEIRTVSGDRKC